MRDAVHQALEGIFVQAAANLRNPAVAPFSPVPLQQAYNLCVPAANAFPLGRADCAMELLRGVIPPGGGGLLGHLRAAPGYLTTYTEQGVCGLCQRVSQQVSLSMLTVPTTAH